MSKSQKVSPDTSLIESNPYSGTPVYADSANAVPQYQQTYFAPAPTQTYHGNQPLFQSQPGGYMPAVPQYVQPVQAVQPFTLKSMLCRCPYCGFTGMTEVEKEVGLGNWLVCGGVALAGGVLGCCLVPFCIDDLKDSIHYCAQCGQNLGRKDVVKL